jgi:hypothetical protein
MSDMVGVLVGIGVSALSGRGSGDVMAERMQTGYGMQQQ